MIVLPGRDALSPFRLDRLNAALSNAVPGAAVRASRWFYALVPDPGAEPDRDRLGEMLDADASALDLGQPTGETLYVVPRVGTRSPWSSKATEILRGTGQPVSSVERGLMLGIDGISAALAVRHRVLARALHDPMTQSLLARPEDLGRMFDEHAPAPLAHVALGDDPNESLKQANSTLGLALSDDEIEYLADRYRELGRDPTDAELMMFAQANSEHCRHKVFNATWRIDGAPMAGTLFGMIRETHRRTPAHTLSAYSDNAAVIEGLPANRFFPAAHSHAFEALPELVHHAIKVETHNHPTAIAPVPGASTGAGGEIRDE